MDYNVKFTFYDDKTYMVNMYDYCIKKTRTQEIMPIYKNVVFIDFEGNEIQDIYINDYEHDLELIEKSIKTSISRTKQNIYNIAKSNKFKYFVTFTFNKEKVDRYSYTECSNEMIKFLKKIKRKDKAIRYIVVPELHKDGAYHFHGLFSDSDIYELKEHKKNIYNCDIYDIGYSIFMEIKDKGKVSGYITKYITKDLTILTKGKKRYWASKNCNKPIEKKMLYSIQNGSFDDLKKELSKECSYRNEVMFVVNKKIRKINYFEISLDK